MARNETSFEEVRSAGDRAFGKRMGHQVTLIQTTTADVERQPVHTGLAEAQDQIISFFAVGDITPLLGDEPSRFHGVVTGTYTYGPADARHRAVTMVGLFDSPANRARLG